MNNLIAHRLQKRKQKQDLKQRLLKKQHNRCYYCKCILDLRDYSPASQPGNIPTLDHKIPSSKGGSNSKENQVIACFDCNNIKDDMTDEEFFTLLESRRIRVESSRI